MKGNTSYKTAWLVLMVPVAAAAAIVAVPVYLIQPFAAQTEKNLEISFLLKSWAPVATLVAALVSIALAVFLWINSKRWFGKAFLIAPLLVVLACAWFARQNHFEWMFNPLAGARFAKVSEVDFVADDEMVMAVQIGGEAVAYPVRLMAYHHIVQDSVGGMPITATY